MFRFRHFANLVLVTFLVTPQSWADNDWNCFGSLENPSDPVVTLLNRLVIAESDTLVQVLPYNSPNWASSVKSPSDWLKVLEGDESAIKERSVARLENNLSPDDSANREHLNQAIYALQLEHYSNLVEYIRSLGLRAFPIYLVSESLTTRPRSNGGFYVRRSPLLIPGVLILPSTEDLPDSESIKTYVEKETLTIFNSFGEPQGVHFNKNFNIRFIGFEVVKDSQRLLKFFEQPIVLSEAVKDSKRSRHN